MLRVRMALDLQMVLSSMDLDLFLTLASLLPMVFLLGLLTLNQVSMKNIPFC